MALNKFLRNAPQKKFTFLFPTVQTGAKPKKSSKLKMLTERVSQEMHLNAMQM